MKKFSVGFVAVVSALIMLFALTGCVTSVVGKTYWFNSYRVLSYGVMTESEKEIFNENLEMKASILRATRAITFNSDGSFPTGGVWRQAGNKVYYANHPNLLKSENCAYYELVGNDLTKIEMSSGAEILLIYKVR